MTLTMFTACGGNNTDSSSNTDSETEEQIEAALSEYQNYIDNLEDFTSLTLYKLDNSNIPACIVKREDTRDILLYENGKLYTYSGEHIFALYSNGVICIEDYAAEEPLLKYIELRDGEFVEVASTNGDMTKTVLEGKEVSQEEFIEFYKSTTDECDYLNTKEYVFYAYYKVDVKTTYKELIDTINNKVKNN